MTWSPEQKVEDQLSRLVLQGFRFVHPRDAQGEIVTVVGIRAHGSVIDMVRLNAEDDVTAIRMPGDETDVLHPGKVLWRQSGELSTVVGALLTLGENDYVEEAPARIGGCWVPGSHGDAKWLAATA